MNDSAQYPRFRWLVLVSAILGYIALCVANLSVAPVLPQVAGSLNIDLGTASNYVMTTFLFSGCVVLVLVGGVVCDRFGVLTSIMLGTLCAAAPMTLMPWIGHSLTGVVCARIVAGFSCGFLFPIMGPIIGLWFPNHQKGLAGGSMNAGVAVGCAVGIILGPAVMPHVKDWQTMSAAVSLVGWIAFAFAAILAMMPKPHLLAHVAPAAGSTDGELFKRALFSSVTLFGVLVSFCAAWGMQCLYALTVTFLAANKPVGAGYGSMTAGQLMLGVTLFAGVIGPVVCGLLLDKVFNGDAKPVFLIGFALMCVFVYLLTLPAVTGNLLVLELALILAGFGVQFVYTTLYYFIARAYAVQVVGKLTGILSGLGTFGGTLGLFIAGVTVKSQGSYHTTLVLQALTALIGFFLVFALMSAYKSTGRAQDAARGQGSGMTDGQAAKATGGS